MPSFDHANEYLMVVRVHVAVSWSIVWALSCLRTYDEIFSSNNIPWKRTLLFLFRWICILLSDEKHHEIDVEFQKWWKYWCVILIAINNWFIFVSPVATCCIVRARPLPWRKKTTKQQGVRVLRCSRTPPPNAEGLHRSFEGPRSSGDRCRQQTSSLETFCWWLIT